MIIAVNVRLLIKDKLEGIGNFTNELFTRLAALRPNDTFYFIFDRIPHPDFIPSANIKAISLKPPTRHPIILIYWFQFALPRLLKKIDADLFISPDGNIPLKAPCKKIAVIHDINFHHRPQDLPKIHAQYYNYFFPRFAKEADKIITVSEFSGADIASSYGVDKEKIEVVYNGSLACFRPMNTSLIKEFRKQNSSGQAYFLYVGAIHARKNILNLLKSFDQFKRSTGSAFKLLMAGNRMFYERDIDNYLQKMFYRDDVVWLGRVSNEFLAKLYGAAFALVYVPFYEGFGMPVLEAMYADIPVITSNVSSLPEVAGNAALLADPNSIDEIAGQMEALATDNLLYERLVANGRIRRQAFNWEKSSLKLNEILNDFILEKPM